MASSNYNRVYIPTNARNNQYILAEFKPDNVFYDSFDNIDKCYERIAKNLFNICDKNALHNVHLIANDKLPITRFHEESYCLETEKQILFFYNPKYHEAHKSYWVKGQQARKIRLLFLATGDELRANAAKFHNKVLDTLVELKTTLPNEVNFKIRDHQHLTYDLYSRLKGHKETYGYKLRSLYPRYQARNCNVPESHSEMSYVSFSLPVSRTMKDNFSHLLQDDTYTQFYAYLEDKFFSACSKKQLTQAAFVADGRLPLVRNSRIDKSGQNSELQKLSFDSDLPSLQLKAFWDKESLVDTLHFVVVAKSDDKRDVGYGKFMNSVESMIRLYAEELKIEPTKQDLNVRFFQHISYVL